MQIEHNQKKRPKQRNLFDSRSGRRTAEGFDYSVHSGRALVLKGKETERDSKKKAKRAERAEQHIARKSPNARKGRARSLWSVPFPTIVELA